MNHHDIHDINDINDIIDNDGDPNDTTCLLIVGFPDGRPVPLPCCGHTQITDKPDLWIIMCSKCHTLCTINGSESLSLPSSLYNGTILKRITVTPCCGVQICTTKPYHSPIKCPACASPWTLMPHHDLYDSPTPNPRHLYTIRNRQKFLESVKKGELNNDNINDNINNNINNRKGIN